MLGKENDMRGKETYSRTAMAQIAPLSDVGA
jgi:hypothetical protein